VRSNARVGAEGASVTSQVDSGSDGASGATKPDPPAGTVGSGRDDVDVTAPDEDNGKNGIPTGMKKFKRSLTIPILRIPRKDEMPTSGFTRSRALLCHSGNIGADACPGLRGSATPARTITGAGSRLQGAAGVTGLFGARRRETR
jgi:hypothetical protein